MGANLRGTTSIGAIQYFNKITSPVMNTTYKISGISTTSLDNLGNIEIRVYHKYSILATTEPVWSENTDYLLNSEVSYNEKAYVCILAHNSGASIILPTNTTYWRLKGSYNKVMEVKDVIAIDMGVDSSNPLYNKTATEMDLIAGQYYFDGLSSVIPGAIKTTGKNLFNPLGYSFINSIDVSQFKTVTTVRVTNSIAQSWRYIAYPMNLKPNTSYTLRIDMSMSGNGIGVIAYDSMNSIVLNSGIITSSGAFSTFTTDNNGLTYFRFYSTGYTSTLGDVTYSNIQLEEGLISTLYESYTETFKYLPDVKLKSLSNGIKDYIDDNKFVKNISDFCDLTTIINWSMSGELTNTIRFAKLLNTTYLNKANTIKGNQALYLNGLVIPHVDTTILTIDTEGFNYNNDGYLYIRILKSRLATIDETSFRNFISTNNAKLIYQLATPIITEIIPITLKSSPRGSIQYMNIKKEIGNYSTKANVTNNSIPIKSVNKLFKILGDGTRTQLNTVIGITIAADKLSFTHTGLTNGDNIEWEYEFDYNLSTTPLIEFEYSNGNNFPITNLIVNSDFSNGTMNWLGANNAYISIVEGNLKCVRGNITTGMAIYQVGFNLPVNHKVYIKCIMKADSLINNFKLRLTDNAWVPKSSPDIVFFNNTPNTFCNISGITTTTGLSTLLSIAGNALSDLPTDSNMIISKQSVLLIDITQVFGAGNEPTQTEIDELLTYFPNSWFDGTTNLTNYKWLMIYFLNKLRMKVNIAQEAWIAPTLNNGWINYGAPLPNVGYYKDNLGIVHLRGVVKNGTIGYTSIFTLPSGYRPANELWFIVSSYNTDGKLVISSNGPVQLIIGSNTSVSLDGITFKAEL